ncbi:hypothetical protein CCP2SC5_1150001 [Azospirillaceae bacterium]
MKDKERLLSLDEPTRFIFSHSALREGWDNPNVFVICALKHSDNTVSRRQEVGRGLRLAVNQSGDRIDDLAIVHQVNVLTVIAGESYKVFVEALQKDISASLSSRPRVANEDYFTNKILRTEHGEVVVTKSMAKQITRYLIKNDYVDDKDRITDSYHLAAKQGALAPLPLELAPMAAAIHQAIATVFSNAQLPEVDNDGKTTISNALNDNFKKREFQELWGKINQKAIYTVKFEPEELIRKTILTLDLSLQVAPLQYLLVKGEQAEQATVEALQKGGAFRVKETTTETHAVSANSIVEYDLLDRVP